MNLSQDINNYSQDLFANLEDDNYRDDFQDAIELPSELQRSRRFNYLADNVVSVPLISSFVVGENELLLEETDLELNSSIFRGLSDSENGNMSQLISNKDLLNAVQLQPLSIDVQQPGPSSAISCDQKVFFDNNDLRWSTVFSDEEQFSLQNWKGDFNFRVAPAPPPEANNKKRCIYSSELNKLYTKDSIAVPFKIEMDYEKMKNPSSYLIRACLVFENPDDVDKPVLRCPSHIDSERKLTDESHVERLPHLVRPGQPHSDTKYIQHSQSKRCYLLMPVVVPEPGTENYERSFVFTCLNSCKGIDAISRRPVSLLFTLYDQSGKLMGRSRTCVRICSAPSRDSNKDKGRVSGEGGSRRKRSGEDINEDNGQTAPKRANVEVAHMGRFSTSVRCTVTAAAGSAEAEDDAMSSSQETIYSQGESGHRIKLRKLVSEIRWALKLKTSQHPAMQDYSKQIYSSLRLTSDLCSSARRLETTLEETTGAERSPDAGFDERN